ncbi:hypothetical protein BGZ49_000395 [Haplosporangium sp. Z 27]|nr:hypothetical protein BGZ49_000395 [Haplosporangium sp. Z 27]
MDPDIRKYINATEALSFPEIRRTIASFLPNSSIAVGASVCLKWHIEFTLELYSTIDLYNAGDRRNPSDAVIKAYSKYIHVLRFRGSASLSFPSYELRCLDDIQNLCPTWSQSNANHIDTLLRQNPTLGSLDLLFGPGGSQAFKRLLGTLSGCFNGVTKLQLSNVQFDHENTELLFKICTRLTDLDLRFAYFQHNSFNFFPQCPLRLRVLKLVDARGLDPSQVLQIARRCPELQHLEMELNRKCDTREFGRVLAVTSPRLQRLSIVSTRLDEDCVFGILNNCINFQHVDLPESGFGQRSTSALINGHSGTLTYLDGMNARALSSEGIQRVMETCKNLTTLKAVKLEAKHIVGGKSAASEARWVCLNLRSLTVFIEGFENENTGMIKRSRCKTVFRQLSQLHKLEVLDVGNNHNHMSTDGIRFQTNLGLENLKTLKQLRELRFVGTCQEMIKHDAKWMVKKLKRLEEVWGKANDEKEELKR